MGVAYKAHKRNGQRYYFSKKGLICCVFINHNFRCQLMAKNDTSWFPEDSSWRETRNGDGLDFLRFFVIDRLIGRIKWCAGHDEKGKAMMLKGLPFAEASVFAKISYAR